MQDETHVDRRFDQTRHEYAANALEVVEEARHYSDHVFSLFQPFIGRRVLKVGAGIGTMSRKLVRTADLPLQFAGSALLEVALFHPDLRFGAHTCSSTSKTMWRR